MTITVTEAERLMMDSLYSAHSALMEAGASAKETISDNDKDILLKGDVIAGNAILDHLKKKVDSFSFYSEEKGKVVVGNYPRMSFVADDNDGTGNQKKGDGSLPHGPIIGVFDNEDPTFNDCLSAGSLEFNTGNLYYASKGRGAYKIIGYANLVDLHRPFRSERIHTSGKKNMHELKVANDQYMLGDMNGSISDSLLENGENHWLNDYGSKASHMAQVAYGAQDVFVSANNSNKKGKNYTGEELGGGYLLVKEAGGAVLDFRGRDIGDGKVGLGDGKTFDTVVAATHELGERFLERIMEKKKVKEYVMNRYY